MTSECQAQKKTIATFATNFDQLILQRDENKIKNIIRDYNRHCHFPPQHSQLLNHFFFVWIGDIPSVAIEYIAIWKEAIGAAGRITIYYDSHCLLFNHYAETFRQIYRLASDASMDSRVAAQNHFQCIIDKFVQTGLTFDQALIRASRQLLPAKTFDLYECLRLAKQHMTALSGDYHLVDIRDDDSVFFDRFFYQIYYQELTLRANAAAACDILRLLLLYQHGGIYIDVDTLPSLCPIYGPLSDKANVNVQNIVRSEHFLRQRRRMQNREIEHNTDITEYEDYLNKNDPKIVQHIKSCLLNTKDLSLPCPKIAVHKHLIALTALENENEYNNNLLAAEKNSKLVRIILREIRRRYQFILNHQFDRKPNHLVPPTHYLHRLSNYRYDAMNNDDNVTLFLSGPILILEVLLGVAYEILPLEKSVSTLALSYALGLGCVAIACREHTSYTPAHMRSSWQ